MADKTTKARARPWPMAASRSGFFKGRLQSALLCFRISQNFTPTRPDKRNYGNPDVESLSSPIFRDLKRSLRCSGDFEADELRVAGSPPFV